jgi:hypothetical protein
MSIKISCVLIAASLLLALAAPLAQTHAQTAARSDSPPGAAPAPFSTDDPAALQKLLQATPEEWSVLYPQLERIRALRDELYATSPIAIPDRRTMFGGALDGPMGGTSLDTPVMPERFGGGRGGAANGPFDPKNAPGRTTDSTSSLARTLRGLAGHAMINVILADQQHPVATAITELQNLLDAPASTEEQIRQKLAALRAIRRKMALDLQTAQNDLMPYLTLDQTALLVSLGYLD